MIPESEFQFYREKMLGVLDELKKGLDEKAKAIELRNFSEVYRLAGAASLICKEAEEIDKKMFERYGGGAQLPEFSIGDVVVVVSGENADESGEVVAVNRTHFSLIYETDHGSREFAFWDEVRKVDG